MITFSKSMLVIMRHKPLTKVQSAQCLLPNRLLAATVEMAMT
jgi:hypothetical protein